MHVRAQPHGHFVAAPAGGHIGHGQQRTVRQMARHPGPAGIAQQRATQLAPHPVGQHQGVPLDLLVQRGADGGHALGAQHLHHFLARIDEHIRALTGGIPQQAVQIGAVDGDIGRTVAVHHALPQRRARQHLAAAAAAGHQLLGHGRHGVQGLLQPPGLQAAHHVGPQLHAGPHLGEFLRPLKQACVPTRVRCAQSGSHPCDAATSNQYLFSHALNCGAETVRSGRAGAAISDVQQTGTTIHAERSAGTTPQI